MQNIEIEDVEYMEAPPRGLHMLGRIFWSLVSYVFVASSSIVVAVYFLK
jgi:hypothetical protein